MQIFIALVFDAESRRYVGVLAARLKRANKDMTFVVISIIYYYNHCHYYSSDYYCTRLKFLFLYLVSELVG